MDLPLCSDSKVAKPPVLARAFILPDFDVPPVRGAVMVTNFFFSSTLTSNMSVLLALRRAFAEYPNGTHGRVGVRTNHTVVVVRIF